MTTTQGQAGERIPLAVPDLRGREKEYVLRCIEDNWVSSAGPFVTECERRMAVLAGRRHGVATVNGTAAIHLSLLGLGVRPDDQVVVPDWTFAGTANAVQHAGAAPFFVDVTRDTWTLDPQSLHKALSSPHHRIRAVIAVHALGHPADMDEISPLCRKAGIPLIEDAAGAIGAQYKGRPVGALGDAAIFSFNGNKTVTAGGGGMVVTDDQVVADRIRALSTQARQGERYEHNEVAFNYRMTNINAALLLAQLERLDEMLASKRCIATAYDEALAGRNDLVPMPRAPWASSGCWLYSVQAQSEIDAESLVRHLNQKGIEARVFWRALSKQRPWAHASRVLTGVADALSGRIVSLPCSSSLSTAQQGRVLQALQAWRGRNRDSEPWT